MLMKNAAPKYYGRFNQGVVTLNLVDIACSSDGDEERFWKIFDERLELCREALMCRHERCLEHLRMLLPFCGSMELLRVLKRVKLLISFFIMAIRLFPWDMPAFANVQDI